MLYATWFCFCFGRKKLVHVSVSGRVKGWSPLLRISSNNGRCRPSNNDIFQWEQFKNTLKNLLILYLLLNFFHTQNIGVKYLHNEYGQIYKYLLKKPRWKNKHTTMGEHSTFQSLHILALAWQSINLLQITKYSSL